MTLPTPVDSVSGGSATFERNENGNISKIRQAETTHPRSPTDVRFMAPIRQSHASIVDSDRRIMASPQNGIIIMKYTILALTVLAVSLPVSAVNGLCTANGTPGVCIPTSSCSSGGGQSFSGLCPNDPADVRCCVKTSCGAGGNCRFTSSCTTGNTAGGFPAVPGFINQSLTKSRRTLSWACNLPVLPPRKRRWRWRWRKWKVPTRQCGYHKHDQIVREVRPEPRPDPVGNGYGHKCIRPGCSEAGPFPLTEAGAVALMQRDLRIATTCLNPAISSTVRLNDNQFGALANWAFNVGCGAMRSSTLVSWLNRGENPNTVAAQELPRWNMAGGHVSNGLIRRRAAEVALFQTASSVIAHPC